jgi:hypothetical protein
VNTHISHRASTVAILRTALALSLLAPLALMAGIPKYDQAGNPLQCEIRGRYDTGYGLALIIPKGLRACGGWNMAWLIPLGTQSEDRYITFSTPFNASLIDDLSSWVSELIASALSDTRKSSAQLVKRAPVSLGGLPGERFVIRYKDEGTSISMIRDSVIALSANKDPDSDVSGYEYSLDLTTTVKDYDHDRPIFEKLITTCESVEEVRRK